ncbi:hypothetical protein BCR33DRAFT_860676 [Rhizoclosmatium globosum]|uniref:Fungal STAND N-terminal Goodbye domain-containing protein n=1 Tax=Rhizoclosmatium globosum TaxID=329046 RepID=A0A1Y2AMH8_9FUNG|nr:hypothetical protein HDU79_011272 [Rhizoclosmatium sp. JEL0117]ORY23789.1 hypothetical protein BCR33DRAFT_860676 [Rhizoclosmatium globosum]|eukprot:ORY23789.1 hypothetical protein BCR33DRAFT_860676 [Rhizoclosmatium globosum]
MVKGLQPSADATGAGTGTGGTPIVKGSIEDLIEEDLLNRLKKESKELLTAVVDSNSKFKELKKLLENVEETEEGYTKLKEKFDAILKTENALSTQVKSVLDELKSVIDDIANTHPILKIAWIAVSVVYKTVQGMKAFDDNIVKVIGKFKRGMNLLNVSLEAQVRGENSKVLLKGDIEHYVDCLLELVDVCKKCQVGPKWYKWCSWSNFKTSMTVDWDNLAKKLDAAAEKLSQAQIAIMSVPDQKEPTMSEKM